MTNYLQKMQDAAANVKTVWPEVVASGDDWRTNNADAVRWFAQFVADNGIDAKWLPDRGEVVALGSVDVELLERKRDAAFCAASEL